MDEMLVLAERHADKKVDDRRLPAKIAGLGWREAVHMAAYRHHDLGVLQEAVLNASTAAAREAYETHLKQFDPQVRDLHEEESWIGVYEPAIRSANAALILLLRDIFGNPFRPATFDPAWRTSTAISLASQMYDSRDFGAMPILADALQDAGCTSDDILDHCRDVKQVHVRGCWVVDLVLGKS
jgi:hypothetical protein